MTEILRNVVLNGSAADLTVDDGIVAAIDPAGAAPARAGAVETDLGGRVVLPPLVNGHAHLDKTFWGLPWREHRRGWTVQERVAHERDIRRTETEPQAPRSVALAREMARAGVGIIRSHVDIDTLVGLGGLDAVLTAQQELGDDAHLQIVAFPQSGILADPGVADLMREALASGADVVGGLDPFGFDGDVQAHLDVVFGLAAAYDAGIDIHLHDSGRPGLDQIEEICARTEALGMQGRVAVSHAYALGSVPHDDMRHTADRLAQARVAIMTNGPVGTTPPVRLLRDAGVTVFTGSDGIRDAWTPYGAPSMTPIARQLAYQSEYFDDDHLETIADVVTYGGAAALGVERYGIAPGAPADLVVFDAGTLAEVVATAAPATLVLRAGRRIA